MNAQSVAEAVCKKMLEGDAATKALGMEVLAISPHSAKLAMTVNANMLNGHSTCHGGMIFSLADSAFAFACNADNHLTVAQTCQITFASPANLGDRLIAEAKEVVRTGRTGVFDCLVRKETGEIVATFRGNSYRTREKVLDIP